MIFIKHLKNSIETEEALDTVIRDYDKQKKGLKIKSKSKHKDLILTKKEKLKL